jgi:hypothetical protein
MSTGLGHHEGEVSGQEGRGPAPGPTPGRHSLRLRGTGHPRRYKFDLSEIVAPYTRHTATENRLGTVV